MMKRFLSILLIVVVSSANFEPLTAQDDIGRPVITARNVHQLQQVDQFGYGVITGMPVWAPSGDYFALASSLGVWIFDIASLATPKLLSRDGVSISGIDFTQDGNQLLVFNRNPNEPSTGTLWDVSSWTINSVTEFPDTTIVMGQFSANGTRALVRGLRHFYIWDLFSGAIQQSSEFNAQLTEVIFSPDESLIASADDEGNVQLWNAQTGEMLMSFSGSGEAISDLAFDEKMTRLSALGNGGWQVWNLITGTELITRTENKYSVALSPDNTFGLVSLGRGELSLWSLDAGVETQRLESSLGNVSAKSWSNDGSMIWAGDLQGNIQAWAADTGDTLFFANGHSDVVFNIVSVPGTGQGLSMGADDRVVLWDLATGEQLAVLISTIGPLFQLQLSPDASKFLVGLPRETSYELWDLHSRRSLGVIDLFSKSLSLLEFSQDGIWIAASDGYQTAIWEVPTGERVQKFDVGIYGNNNIVASANSLIVAVTGPDGSFDVWNVLTQRRLMSTYGAEIEAQYSRAVAQSPDGRLIAAHTWNGSEENGTIQLWDIESTEINSVFNGHTGSVWDICFSPNGESIISIGQDQTIRLWNVTSGMPLTVIENQAGISTDVACSPDGAQFATATRGTQGLVTLWSTNNGQLLKTLNVNARAAHDVAYNSTGNLIAIGTENGFEVWDVEKGVNLVFFPQDVIDVVAFSPDDTILATGGRDGIVRLWTIEGKAINTEH